MIKLNKTFQLICRAITIVALVVNLWMFGLPSFSALAASNTPASGNNYTHTQLTEQDSDVARNRKARVEGISDCTEYLINGDKNTAANLDKPLDGMGNYHLAKTLRVSDNPQPTEAEVEFKRCLEEQGIAPKP